MPQTRITLVTFNVWFGHYRRAERRRALFDILRRADPDIIGLQEVTPEFLEALEDEDWVSGYRVADVPVSPYGVLMLSRLPVKEFTLHELPSNMGRHLLVAEPEDPGDLAVATVHLESLRYADTRKRQLETIFPILAPYDHAVLMGDFNLCSTWDENRHLDPDYLDIWPHLHGDDPGFTEDTDINKMRLLVNPTPTQVRFDRVILRSGTSTGSGTGSGTDDARWRPVAMERLGTEPIAPDTPEVFPSDHFGLRAVIEVDESAGIS